MKITGGLFGSMVMQRNSENLCMQKITGIAAANSEVRVSCGDAVSCGTSDADGVFELVFSGLATGGPYEITVSDGVETLVVPDVLVGDVWILAGQSNMQGCGNLNNAMEPHRFVRAYFMRDEWGVAVEPVTNLAEAKAEVHWTLLGGHNYHFDNPPLKGAGAAIAFGRGMYERLSVPQGLIACAHGGTRMTQWSPSLKDKGDDSLYGAMLNRVNRNGGRVAGLIWYQGCSDANLENQGEFFTRTCEFFESLRSDLGFPDMPVVSVQIGRVVGDSDNPMTWTLVRDDQLKLQKTVSRLAVVPSIDLDLDDCIHLSGMAQRKLGVRIAEAACTLTCVAQSNPMPIEFESLETSFDSVFKHPVVKVHFRNVVGRLVYFGSRPAGFSVIAGETESNLIFRTELEGDTVTLKLTGALPLALLELVYGWGLNPFTNIYDEAGRPVPAFGPVRLSSGCISTPFPSLLEVSCGITEMSFADSQYLSDAFGAFKYSQAECVAFYAFPRDMSAMAGREHLRIFRTAYEFPCDMSIETGFGYDGPVHLFMDGVLIYSDPAGSNPIVCDSAKIKLDIPSGRHEFYAVLDARSGQSWGISFIIRNTKVVYTPEITRDDLAKNLPKEIGFHHDID